MSSFGNRGWCRTWLAGLVLAAHLPSGVTAQAVPASLASAVAQSGGRVLIRLRPSPLASLRTPGSPLVSDAEADQASARLVGRYGIRPHGRALRSATLFATVDAASLAALAADTLVASVEPDVLTYLADADPGASTPAPAIATTAITARADAVPWGVDRVGAQAAWAAGYTGAGVKVGIIDSGIDPSHPDLLITGGFDFTTSSPLPTAWADNIALCGGHGTHVAGTIGARQNGTGIIGVAPGAQLFALKVFEVINGGCAAWTSNQIAAIDWAVSHGLKVINLSIASSTALQAYQDAVNAAAAAGVVVVAAAGNNSGGPVTYPAAYQNAVAVGGLTAANAVAYFSNIGPQLWVSAPAVSIVSTVPGGSTGTKSGTSMAAPHVAGVAALLFQQHPSWTATQIRDALHTGALDVSSPGWDSGTGWGLVQAPGGGGGGGGGGDTTTVALSVSPGSRHGIVEQGGAAPSDQATVTLTGTAAATTTWTATKRKSWTTLTTSGGTNSGTVRWTRNAFGLAPGIYVDTITVVASGATGSPARVVDTLEVTAPPTPAVLALAPGSRRAAVVAGGAAPPDSATITLTGPNAWSVSWAATARHAWTQLTTASGAGNGTVRWNRNAAGLAPGTYVDTITVTAAATGAPARVIDTLVVSAPPVALTLSVSPRSRRVGVVQGGSAPGDQAFVSLTGAGAAGTGWTATRTRTWITLVTAAGTGSGTVRWTRDATGLAPGIYVDTIRVVATGAAGSPTTVIDSLVVSAPTVSVTLTLNPVSRRGITEFDGAAPSDSVAIQLSGADAATAHWTATHSSGWTALESSGGTGAATLRWARIAGGLTPGTYVDTITVTIPGATGSPAIVVDSMIINSIQPLALALSTGSRRVEAIAGDPAIEDQVLVFLTGQGATTTTWYASAAHSWTSVGTPGGTGPGTLRWQRSLAGLPAGTYVDTITVTSGPLTARVVDSLVIASNGQGGTIVLARASRRSRQLRMDGQQTSIGSDSVVVQSVNGLAPSGGWTATTTSNWIHLDTWAGAFPGMLRWTRAVAGLGNGMHVDTIVVQLVADPAFRGVFVDSVEVVGVTSPTPALAATALFSGGGLNGDQLAILDAAGNKNGRYDLGDFLAWVDRGNIQLNAAVMATVRRAMAAEAGGAGSGDPPVLRKPDP